MRAKAKDERPPVSRPSPSMAAIMLLATSALSSDTILEGRDTVKKHVRHFLGTVYVERLGIGFRSFRPTIYKTLFNKDTERNMRMFLFGANYSSRMTLFAFRLNNIFYMHTPQL